MKKHLVLLSFLLCVIGPQLATAEDNPVIEAARQAEVRLDARVGLTIHDTGSGERWFYRDDERFPIASTFKVFACAALLARQDAGDENLDRRVGITQADLVTYSPVTEGWVG